MTFAELIRDLDDAVIVGDPTVEINKVEVDSRLISPNDVFVAVPGFADDGQRYIPDAIKKGAIALVTPADAQVSVKCTARVADIRKAISRIAARFYDHPSRLLDLVGITGTNGKTTVTWLLKSIFDQTGKTSGVIGTLGYFSTSQTLDAVNTTPGPLELERVLSTMVKDGVRYVASEVSSHALAMYRVEDLDFKVVAVTNITQDHFDYHKTFENYREAKAHILDLAVGDSKWAVLNRDDASFDYLNARVKSPLLTFALNDSRADVRLDKIAMSTNGSEFSLITPFGTEQVRLNLLGKFNLENALSAATCALALGIKPAQIASGLSDVKFVNGRAQAVSIGQPFTVLVDFAHTPDALKNILQTAREICKGRLLVLFGCGGDRDKSKRPLMGKVTSELADILIVTSDNPRTEDPNAIIEDIKPGLDRRKQVEIEVDRRKAIGIAVSLCRENDVLIIAGKGHEQYQTIGKQRLHFDDREEVEAALRRRLS